MCHVFPPLVSIFGLFPVLVSCHYDSCPAVFVLLSVINLCILVHACSVWFRLVYLWLPGVSCLSALMSWLKTIIWVYVLVCVFLFLPRVCTVTISFQNCMTYFPLNGQKKKNRFPLTSIFFSIPHKSVSHTGEEVDPHLAFYYILLNDYDQLLINIYLSMNLMILIISVILQWSKVRISESSNITCFSHTGPSLHDQLTY